jgi:Tol biopolymer transport system component
MPARPSHHAVLRTAALALSLTIAACDGGESPLAPNAAEPATPEIAPVAPAPELLTAGTGPRILFSSARSGGTDIYRMDPDGNNVVRVTSFSGAEETPAWSWDNKRIAFVRHRVDASNVSRPDIYVMNADGTGKRWVRSGPSPFGITYPAWSPDGKLLAVTAWVNGSPHLAVMDVASGAMILINGVDGPMAWDPSFDPTGTKILFVSQYGTTMETINLDGSGRQVIKKGFSFNGPTFSPDGKRIAYSFDGGGNLDVYVRNLATGTDKRLTTNADWDFDPTWSADGSRIAFTSFRGGVFPNGQIWTVSSAGGTQVRITHTDKNERSAAWSH